MSKETRCTNLKQAENIALMALAFLAEDADRLSRFLSLSGLNPEILRENADKREFLAAVLAHLLSDESLLMVFCASQAIPPENIKPAHRVLAEVDNNKPA